MKYLDEMSDEWIHVANILNLPKTVINSIQLSGLKNSQALLRRVVEWWFTNTDNPEWHQGKFQAKGRIAYACMGLNS